MTSSRHSQYHWCCAGVDVCFWSANSHLSSAYRVSCIRNCSLYSLVNIALDLSMYNNLGTIKSRVVVESRTFDCYCVFQMLFFPLSKWIRIRTVYEVQVKLTWAVQKWPKWVICTGFAMFCLHWNWGEVSFFETVGVSRSSTEIKPGLCCTVCNAQGVRLYGGAF